MRYSLLSLLLFATSLRAASNGEALSGGSVVLTAELHDKHAVTGAVKEDEEEEEASNDLEQDVREPTLYDEEEDDRAEQDLRREEERRLEEEEEELRRLEEEEEELRRLEEEEEDRRRFEEEEEERRLDEEEQYRRDEEDQYRLDEEEDRRFEEEEDRRRDEEEEQYRLEEASYRAGEGDDYYDDQEQSEPSALISEHMQEPYDDYGLDLLRDFHASPMKKVSSIGQKSAQDPASEKARKRQKRIEATQRFKARRSMRLAWKKSKADKSRISRKVSARHALQGDRVPKDMYRFVEEETEPVVYLSVSTPRALEAESAAKVRAVAKEVDEEEEEEGEGDKGEEEEEEDEAIQKAGNIEKTQKTENKEEEQAASSRQMSARRASIPYLGNPGTFVLVTIVTAAGLHYFGLVNLATLYSWNQ